MTPNALAPCIAKAASTVINPQAHYVAPANQASNKMGDETRVAPIIITPLRDKDITMIVNKMRDKVRNLRATQTLTLEVWGMTEDIPSLFIIELLIK